ncbi:hypothetical protein HNY73_009878 [Argiope bruennichi]|uniref:Uncharacterized protein n=1 Tax=Argiope bruennichi TaxID=94029 RepID=A0A8T0FDI0_ARGBR|nr:hypothetical protein HNY73_009878 [Argiope bruennichi]
MYVADVTDPCILLLDFLKNYDITLDLKKRELHATGEEVPLFGLDTRTSLVSDFGFRRHRCSGREVVPVRLANISDGMKSYQKGEEIATCSAVTSIEQRNGRTSAVPMDDLMEQQTGRSTRREAKDNSQKFDPRIARCLLLLVQGCGANETHTTPN